MLPVIVMLLVMVMMAVSIHSSYPTMLAPIIALRSLRFFFVIIDNKSCACTVILKLCFITDHFAECRTYLFGSTKPVHNQTIHVNT